MKLSKFDSQILAFLAQSGYGAPGQARQEKLWYIKHDESYLQRLGKLEQAGYVKRRVSGSETLVKLTAAGRKALVLYIPPAPKREKQIKPAPEPKPVMVKPKATKKAKSGGRFSFQRRGWLRRLVLGS